MLNIYGPVDLEVGVHVCSIHSVPAQSKLQFSIRVAVLKKEAVAAVYWFLWSNSQFMK